MSPGCVYTYSCWRLVAFTSVESMGCQYGVYTYWRGACVARFDYDGHVERPQNVKRATESDFTSFLFKWLQEVHSLI